MSVTDSLPNHADRLAPAHPHHADRARSRRRLCRPAGRQRQAAVACSRRFRRPSPISACRRTPSSWCRGSSSRRWRATGRKARGRSRGRRRGASRNFSACRPTRVKALNRALFEAGIFVIRDNEQGKRYGRRGPDGRIIEAYGFDLTPLAQRYDEFVRIAAEAKIERERMKALAQARDDRPAGDPPGRRGAGGPRPPARGMAAPRRPRRPI